MAHCTVKTSWLIKQAMMDCNTTYKQAASKQVMRKLSGCLRSGKKSGTYTCPIHSVYSRVLKNSDNVKKDFFSLISLLVYLIMPFQLLD